MLHKPTMRLDRASVVSDIDPARVALWLAGFDQLSFAIEQPLCSPVREFAVLDSASDVAALLAGIAPAPCERDDSGALIPVMLPADIARIRVAVAIGADRLYQPMIIAHAGRTPGVTHDDETESDAWFTASGDFPLYALPFIVAAD